MSLAHRPLDGHEARPAARHVARHGIWLFSSAVANYLAAILESLLEKVHVPIYGFLIVSSIGPAVLLLALTPLLKKWMHGKA